MPWMTLAQLISISRRRRIDPTSIEVYVEEEVVYPRPRNLGERFEPGLAAEGSEPEYDADEEEY